MATPHDRGLRRARARAFLAALAAALACALAGCGDPAPPTQPGAAVERSVILITCDTLRADRLGFLGCPRATSPNLDALAAESLVFDSAWSTAPLTGPALSALLTGRPPEELGLSDNRNVLAAEAETLAETLAAHGAATAAIVSNWVLRRRAELPGAGVQQGFAHFDDAMDEAEPARPDLRERRAPATTDAALAWLDAHAAERPFFLWVHYQDPHGPYTAPAEFLGAPVEGPADEPALEVGRDQRGRGALPTYQVVDDERRPALYRQRYEAEIRYFDRELGRLLADLRARGLLERALVVFTADHGESMGERGFFFSHGQHLHEELVRVPLLVRPPGGARGERARHAPASHLDLAPTILAFAGLASGPRRGVDLLAGEAPARVLPQFLRGQWGALEGGHRLIVGEAGAQLFDLARDPLEEHDLARQSPELVRSLTERHHALARAAPPPLRAAEPPPDAAAESGLEALGYAGEDGDEPAPAPR